MFFRSRTVSVVVCVLASLLVIPSSPGLASTESESGECEVPVPDSGQSPEAEWTSGDPYCSADPTHIDETHTLGGPHDSAEEQQPRSPYPGHGNDGYLQWVGPWAYWSDFTGVYGALNVVDPAVQRADSYGTESNMDYLNQRLLMECPASSGKWLEIGWTEVAFRDNRQYIYTNFLHQGNPHWFAFYDQYPVVPGQRIFVQIVKEGNWLQALLFWNGSWHELTREWVGESESCSPEAMVEVSAQSSSKNIGYSDIRFGTSATDANGMKLRPSWTNTFESWDTDFTTLNNTNKAGGGYNSEFDPSWYWGRVTWRNVPPSASLTVMPAQGDTTTQFEATLMGRDRDEEQLTYEIDWGDGTVTNGANGTHRYERPADYIVTGRTIDPLGQEGADTQAVKVCSTQANSTCVENAPSVGNSLQPVTTPETCVGTTCIESHTVDPCEQAASGPTEDSCGSTPPRDLASVLTRGPEAVEMEQTPLNQAIAITINAAQQTQPGEGGRCPKAAPGTRSYKENRKCDAEGRKRHLGNRIRDLSVKELMAEVDGMGYTPDLILLQEVNLDDTRAIRDILNNRFVVPASETSESMSCTALTCFKIAVSGRGKVSDADAALINDTSIIFNSITMAKGNAGTVDTGYLLSEACNRPATGDLLEDDQDGDGILDCPGMSRSDGRVGKRTTKRHSWAMFSETGSSYSVAAMSLHFVRNSHLKAGKADEKKRQWVEKVADHLRTMAPSSTTYAIGGDFNIERCPFEGDPATSESVSCDELEWWTVMTTPDDTSTSLREGLGFDDTIWATHGPARNPDDAQARIDKQYEDGLLPDGETANRRGLRIDFIFTRSNASSAADEPFYASFDITCGLNPPSGVVPNCDRFDNPDRYSDHRLQWSFTTPLDPSIEPGPLPSITPLPTP